MVQPYSGALSISRILLWVLRVFNLFMGVCLVVAFVASFPFDTQFFEFFSKRPPRIDPSWLVPALRIWMVLALPMVAAVHILLSRLLEMIETVRTGDPFVPENATRLKTIAWCALVNELLRLAYGVMAATLNAAGSNIDWKFSANGWLGVVLVFVLARVFEEGTRMRQDLESMI
jgi:hypothetical protein